jgi:hypothetical protein
VPITDHRLLTLRGFLISALRQQRRQLGINRFSNQLAGTLTYQIV